VLLTARPLAAAARARAAVTFPRGPFCVTRDRHIEKPRVQEEREPRGSSGRFASSGGSPRRQAKVGSSAASRPPARPLQANVLQEAQSSLHRPRRARRKSRLGGMVETHRDSDQGAARNNARPEAQYIAVAKLPVKF
jgi:hypothetical protein